jgi:hypothetical protein
MLIPNKMLKSLWISWRIFQKMFLFDYVYALSLPKEKEHQQVLLEFNAYVAKK